ncbi:MAG: hypothetical protein KGL74_14060 [Elusimicrobia bacterium]|nr:hypothetical protein [Elusimicrobiota bacterium]MDE2512245.1 hypothetical protein [Elusimicrobiota bacterium]
MRFFLAAALLSLFSSAASAAPMGPAAQTLEALHGTAVNDPARFFDGMSDRVSVVEPSGYVALPPAPAEPPAEIKFDSRRIAPGLTLHEPVPPLPKASRARAAASSDAVYYVIGASLVAAAVLLLLLL